MSIVSCEAIRAVHNHFLSFVRYYQLELFTATNRGEELRINDWKPWILTNKLFGLTFDILVENQHLFAVYETSLTENFKISIFR